jgi:UDP-GlcNAc3NAcA epimerase
LTTVIHIIGNRPQIIKLAVLYKQLAQNKGIQQKIVHTGQHFSYNMSDVFFDELQLPKPDVNFNIQNPSAALFIGEAIHALQNYFLLQQAAIAFTYGDTNTTLAAAIAAKKCALKLFHFEAGVRTYDNCMPEEMNRILTDRLADVNYCCTKKNVATLQQEGYGNAIMSDVVHTGDLMLDAFLHIAPAKDAPIKTSQYIVSTIHREANICRPTQLNDIITALNIINKNIEVVMPLHPHTKKRMEQYNIVPSFTITPPLGYPGMKKLLQNAAYVITDSGGFSREAYFLQKKSLIIMDHPFWPEIMEANCSVNCSATQVEIMEGFNKISQLQPNFDTQIFGNGNAAKNICNHLSDYLK